MTAGSSNMMLKPHGASRIGPAMMLRPLFAMLIAMAMLLAPLGARAGVAMAAAPADHHAAMAEEHCDGQPDRQQPDQAKVDGCCVAMCAAVAVSPAAPAQPISYDRIAERPAKDIFRQGIPGELPTPPPRLS